MLNADGTGSLKLNKMTHEGTWKQDFNELVFTYQQYGEQTWKARRYQEDDIYVLRSNIDSEIFCPKSALAAMKKKAETNRYSLKWKEEVKLSFLEFQLNNAFVYRSDRDALTKVDYTLDVKKGKKYVVFTGTVVNPGDRYLRLDNYCHTEVILDGKKTYKAEIKTTTDNRYYSGTVDAGNKQKLFIIAEVPESVLKSAKSATLKFSFYNGLSKVPGYDFQGDYFFGMKLSEAKLTAMRKGTARKKTYFKESAKLPVPTSYVDVLQGGGPNRTKGSVTGNRTGYQYIFRNRYSDGNTKKLCTSYINALIKDGFKVEKMNLRNYNDAYYYVTLKNKLIGTIQMPSSSNSWYFCVFAIK